MEPGHKEPQTLGEFLGTQDPRSEEERSLLDDYAAYANLSGREFCQKVVESKEFRQYLMVGITLGTLAPAIALRIMDHAWGKPPDRVELTGKDGKPIEQVTEVRRTVVPSPRAVGKAIKEALLESKESVH